MADSNPSFEPIGPTSDPGSTINRGIYLTCEHSSSVVPPPWKGWPAEDSWIVGMHWSIDIGAEIMARELAGGPSC